MKYLEIFNILKCIGVKSIIKFIIKFIICVVITPFMIIWSWLNWDPKDWDSFLKYMWK